jgi:hypothetical protein
MSNHAALARIVQRELQEIATGHGENARREFLEKLRETSGPYDQLSFLQQQSIRGESGRISNLFSFGRVSPSLRREFVPCGHLNLSAAAV